jgi:hypothetical protein
MKSSLFLLRTLCVLLVPQSLIANSQAVMDPHRRLELQVSCARQFLDTQITSRQFVDLNDGTIGLRKGADPASGYFVISEAEARYVDKDPNLLWAFRMGTLDRIVKPPSSDGVFVDRGVPADLDTVNNVLEQSILWSLERTAISMETIGKEWFSEIEVSEDIRAVYCGCQRLPVFNKAIQELLTLEAAGRKFLKPIECDALIM